MSSAQTIVRNTFFLSISEIISKAISFLILVIMTRSFGDVGFGKYSFAVAYFSMFMFFTDFGVSSFMLREIARDKSHAKKYFDNVLTFTIILSLIALLVAVAGITIVGKSNETIAIVALVGAYMVLTQIVQPFRLLFNAYEKMQYVAAVNVIERIVALLLAFFFFLKGYGLIPFMIVFICSYLVALVVAVIITRKKFLSFNLQLDTVFIKVMLKGSMPFWFTSIFLMIYYRVDTLILTYLKGYQVVGWYSAAYRVIEALTFIPFIVVGATFPAMSKLNISSKEQLHLLFERCFYYLFIVGLPIGIATSLFANRILPIIYGPEFLGSIPALQILAWAGVLVFFNYLFGYLLNAIDKQHLFAIASGLTLLLGIFYNLILILNLSYIGAAYATVLTQLTAFLITYYFAARNSYSIDFVKTTVKPLIAGAIMVGVIFLLSSLHIFILAPIAAFSYALVIVATGAVGKEEFLLIKTLVTKQKK